MENVFSQLKGMLGSAASQTYEKIGNILPEAVIAVVIIGVGLLISAGLYFLAIRIMEFFALDKLAGKTPLQKMLHNVGIHKNISHILALLIFWLGVLVTLIFAADVLNLEQVSNALAIVTRFIPQIIAALLIVVFGMLLAKFLQVFVEQTLGRAHVNFSIIAGKVVYIAVLLLVLHLVFVQLGFDLSIITTNVLLAFVAFLVLLGIAFIISCKTLLENMCACYQLRQHVHVGDTLMIEGSAGMVQAFTLTSVILGSNGQRIVLPALKFFTSTYTITQHHGEQE